MSKYSAILQKYLLTLEEKEKEIKEILQAVPCVQVLYLCLAHDQPAACGLYVALPSLSRSHLLPQTIMASPLLH